MTDFTKWDKIATSVVAATEAEAQRDVEESDAALGLRGPLSEAEKKDAEAHEALKKLKKEWNEKEKGETAQKLIVTRNAENFTLKPSDFNEKRVLVLFECENIDVDLDASLTEMGLIKIFIEKCTRVQVYLRCKLVTSFVDISRSTEISLTILETLHTVQCDLSHDVSVVWRDAEVFDSAAPEGPKIYHAGTSKIFIDAGNGLRTAQIKKKLSDNDEDQFVTHLVSDKMTTEKIVLSGDSSRLIGATQRELDQDNVNVEARRAARLLDEKSKGNTAFQNREYAQAIAHYTLAIDACGTPEEKEASSSSDKAILFANRAAAFLKLGQPEKALDDADAARLLVPTYDKALFRKGLALHALQRYSDALPVLGSALNIEPKNSQIKDALRFAEMRLNRGSGNLRNPYASS